MRQLAAQQSVDESASHSGEQEHNEHRIAAAQQDKHGAGADAGQCPAEAEYKTADNIALPALVFILDDNFCALRGFHVRSFDELYRHCAHRNSGKDNAVHMERLEVEHLENAVPRHGFCFIQRHAEQDAYEDIF